MKLRQIGQIWLPLFCSVLLPASALPAQPREPTPKTTLTGRGGILAAYHRMGLLVDLRLELRHRLFDADSPLLSNNYAQVTLSSVNSIAHTQSGGSLEIAPTSFLKLRGGYDFLGYYGVLNILLPLKDCQNASALGPTDSRCDFHRDIGANAVAEETADHGNRTWMEGLFQARLGRISAVATVSYEKWWFREQWRAPLGFDYWYNSFHMVPQARSDEIMAHQSLLLYEFLPDRGGSEPQLLAGLVDSLVHTSATDYTLNRFGVVAFLRFPELGVRDLTFMLAAQWYTQDRYLKGNWMPLIAIQVAMATADLLN